MPLVEITEKEHFVIEVIRQFRFLPDYSIKGITVNSDEPGVIFYIWKSNVSVHVKWLASNSFSLNIVKKRWFIKKHILIHDLYSHFQAGDLIENMDFSNYCEIIKKNAEFVEKYLIPVINGEKWIKPDK